ncbi:MAG: hypothetical protein ACREQZ_13750, partial [Woeseiaceae bacterium]
MAADLQTSSIRDPQQQLNDLKLEIADRVAKGKDTGDLWHRYVALFLVANDLSIAGPVEIDRATIADILVNGAKDVSGPGLEAANPTLRALTRDYLAHLAESGLPLTDLLQDPAAGGDPVV